MPSPAPPKTTKRRAPMSCDRCKSRKTKCVDPVPGPCRFCASIHAVCHLDPSRRRQRPYYHVSEEEFRYMTKALEHFLPNVELNLQNLRAVVQSFDGGQQQQQQQPLALPATTASAATAQTGPAQPAQPAQPAAQPYESDDPPEDTVLPDAPCLSSTRASSASASSASASAADSVHDSATPASTADGRKPDDAAALLLDEIDALHAAMGWLRLDAKGTYRHIGADSSYGFHAAVRALHHHPDAAPTDVLPPLTAAPPLPPAPATPDGGAPAAAAAAAGGGGHGTAATSSATASASATTATTTQIFLPRRDLCNRCIARFFRDIQSVYWFWSAERFHAELDRLYGGDPASATPALLGSLYAVLALTCEREAAAATASSTTSSSSSSSSSPPDADAAAASAAAAAAAARYLALAKALVPALCDAADSDSVRALCLLALALQSAMCTTTAAVYVGAAARIALSLGLHRPRAPAAFEPRTCLQRQVDVRLYATLFLLDADVAACYGTPPAIAEAHAAARPRDLSEQILSPGSYMPLDCLPVACDLAQIRRRLRAVLYERVGEQGHSTTTTTTTTASVAAVRDGLAALRAWYAAMPSHLRDAARVAPYHQRAVSVLHLRYWSAVVFATRPFLLYRVRRQPRRRRARDAAENTTENADTDDLPPAKHAAYAAFAATCVDAARQALRVVGFMRDAGLLSSLVTLDAACLVEILQVFLLARADPSDTEETGASAAPEESPEDAVRTCLLTLQGMDQFFWTRHVLAEVRAQLHETGLLPHGGFPGQQAATPGRFFFEVSGPTQTQAQTQTQPQQDPVGVLTFPGHPPRLATAPTTPGLAMDSYFLDLNDAFFAVPDDAAAAPLLPESFEECMAGGMAL